MHETKPIFTAQFHPEHKGGPTDTEVSDFISFKLVLKTTMLAWLLFRENKQTNTKIFKSHSFTSENSYNAQTY